MAAHLTLRTATPADNEFAYHAKKAAFREYVEQIWGWDEAEQRRLHGQRFHVQDFRIITVDGVDSGVMAIVLEPDCVKVNQLFILPEYQGLGTGGRCMQIIMEEAKQLGLPVRLRVSKLNLRAQAFYERLGLEPTGETESHLLMEWRLEEMARLHFEETT